WNGDLPPQGCQYTYGSGVLKVRHGLLVFVPVVSDMLKRGFPIPKPCQDGGGGGHEEEEDGPGAAG
ncbi:hypothetical protein HGM15179_018330, partial [Zosterops borbonicus]